MVKSIVSLLFASVVLLPVRVCAQEDAPPEPTPSRWESHHSVSVNGETVEYDAVLGSTSYQLRIHFGLQHIYTQ